MDRVRSGVVDRDEAVFVVTELRLDSTAEALPARRATDTLERDFDALLDPFEPAAFGRFALSRMDLAADDVRVAAFFVGFDLGFAFVDINAATYTGYAS